jgi:serine/threonine-protein kinase
MNVPEIPRVIGRYRVLGVLGAGGMGTVYRAHDPLIDRHVAIKVVRTDALASDTRAEYLDRFRQEAQAAGRCSHPAIVAVHDFSSDDGDPYIVMELVEGRSLQKVLHEPSGRTALPIAAILVQVLDGLGYAHRLGVTHRDIKPANIVVTAAGHAKIADFGIARLGGASLTHAGDLLGTPGYMAPEQLADVGVDHRADLFAVGAVLYEAITGRPPFAGRNTGETLQRLASPDAASMVAVEAAGAGAYVTLLRRALAKSPDQRFQSAEAFAAALQAARTARPPPVGCDDDDTATVPVQAATADNTGRWDRATLQRVERTLAHYVGPMARVVVQQAARESASADDLYRSLADSLQRTADRSAFLRSLGSGRVEPTLAQRARTEPTLSRAAPPGVIPADAIAAAQAALAFHVGPIARVLAQQAATQASSSRDFIERLCRHAGKPGEDATLRRSLRADVEPRLP